MGAGRTVLGVGLGGGLDGVALLLHPNVEQGLARAQLALQRGGQAQQALPKAEIEQVPQVLQAPQVLRSTTARRRQRR